MACGASSARSRSAEPVVRLPEVRHPVRLVAIVAGVVALLVVLGSTCSAPERRTLPAPSSTSSTQPEAPTSTVDHSRTVLQPVPGETTTTLAESGDATLSGVVTGPAGPVPGATVRIERLVRDAVQVRVVQAGADGTWVLQGVPGGRMRVRAFAPPSLAMLEPEIFFLREAEPRELRLAVVEHAGVVVLSDVTPEAPTVGATVNVAVRVVQKVVDGEGIARTAPVPGAALQLQSAGWIFVNGPGATGADGVAVFTFRCEQAGSVSAAVALFDGVEQRTYPLDVPACGPRPTTTTTTTSTTTTTDPDETTTSTTTTTQAEDG